MIAARRESMRLRVERDLALSPLSGCSRHHGSVKVLIVEDDVPLASALRRGLRAEGIVADVAVRGEDALWMIAAGEFDAVVLDVMLPGIDGFETCRRLRGDGVWTPIIMLTARDEVDDRVRGLDEGADDYLVKPFSLAELLAGCGRWPAGARWSGRWCWRWARCDSTRPRTRSGGVTRRSSCLRRNSRCSRRSCAVPAR